MVTLSSIRMPPDEVRAWKEEFGQLGREGRYFFSINRYFFEVAKPGGSRDHRA